MQKLRLSSHYVNVLQLGMVAYDIAESVMGVCRVCSPVEKKIGLISGNVGGMCVLL